MTDQDLDAIEARLTRELEEARCFLMWEANDPTSPEYELVEAQVARCRSLLLLVDFQRTMRALQRERGRL